MHNIQNYTCECPKQDVCEQKKNMKGREMSSSSKYYMGPSWHIFEHYSLYIITDKNSVSLSTVAGCTPQAYLAVVPLLGVGAIE
jgi:hypothetical protein